MGLQLATGWHSGFLTERSVEAEWKAAADHVRLLEECGCQVLVYGECGMMEGDSPWDEPLSRRTKLKSIDLAAYAEKVGEFSVGLNKRGIKLAYHYHLKMIVETAEEIATFCEATRPEVGLLLDTGHAYAAGADYGEILRRFGDRVVHIHLKDVRRDVLDWARKIDVTFNSAVREGLFTVPGDGSVDFSEIRKFIRSSGYSGWVVVEAEQDPAKAAPRFIRRKPTSTSKISSSDQPSERQPMSNSLNIGLVGSGFMGQAHADAYRRAGILYRNLPAPRCCTP